MTQTTADDRTLDGPIPSIGDLFLAFAGIAVMGFGGVMPWARRMLVEQRKWMMGEEFTEAYSLAQFLPGGNIINLAAVVGQRFHGAAGATAAVLGLMAGPTVIVTGLGLIYLRYGQIQAVHDALAGVAAGAAGLIVVMAVKMAEPLVRRRETVAGAIAAVAFAAIVVARLPLLLVVAILVPVSIAIAWRRLP